jgi:hypothetical protein
MFTRLKNVFRPVLQHRNDFATFCTLPVTNGTIKQLIEQFEHHGIGYVFGGSLACSAYGYVQSTNRYVVNIDHTIPDRFLKALDVFDVRIDPDHCMGGMFGYQYFVTNEWQDSGRVKMWLDNSHFTFKFPLSTFDKQSVQNATSSSASQNIPVLSFEDLCTLKLLHFRKQDREDLYRLWVFCGHTVKWHYYIKFVHETFISTPRNRRRDFVVLCMNYGV